MQQHERSDLNHTFPLGHVAGIFLDSKTGGVLLKEKADAFLAPAFSSAALMVRFFLYFTVLLTGSTPHTRWL